MAWRGVEEKETADGRSLLLAGRGGRWGGGRRDVNLFLLYVNHYRERKLRGRVPLGLAPRLFSSLGRRQLTVSGAGSKCPWTFANRAEEDGGKESRASCGDVGGCCFFF